MLAVGRVLVLLGAAVGVPVGVRVYLPRSADGSFGAAEPAVVVKSSWTYNQYVEHFIGAREMAGKVAPGTIRREKEELSSLGFVIGEMKLQDITPDVLESALLDLRSGKSKSGKRLSGTYLNDICKKASLMFSHAMKNKIISSNPCDAVNKPKIDTAEKRSLDGSKIHVLLAALNPTQHMECGVILATTLEMRHLLGGSVSFRKTSDAPQAPMNETLPPRRRLISGRRLVSTAV